MDLVLVQCGVDPWLVPMVVVWALQRLWAHGDFVAHKWSRGGKVMAYSKQIVWMCQDTCHILIYMFASWIPLVNMYLCILELDTYPGGSARES